MADRQDLYDWFETGDQPTENQFKALIDSTYGNDQTLTFSPSTGKLSISSSGDNPSLADVDLSSLNANYLKYDRTTKSLSVVSSPPGSNEVTTGIRGIWDYLGNTGTSGDISFTGGKVGIGTTNPLARLQVTGGWTRLQELNVIGDAHVQGSLYFDPPVGSGSIPSSNLLSVDRLSSNFARGNTANKNTLPTAKAVENYVEAYAVNHLLLAGVSGSTGLGTGGIIEYSSIMRTMYNGLYNNLAGDFEFEAPFDGYYEFYLNLVGTGPNYANISINLRREMASSTAITVVKEETLGTSGIRTSGTMILNLFTGNKVSATITGASGITLNSGSLFSVKSLGRQPWTGPSGSN